jgi:hypothetical protein
MRRGWSGPANCPALPTQQTRNISFKPGRCRNLRPFRRARGRPFTIAWRRGQVPQPVHAGDYYMTMRMLIDARHREETRVAVVKGNRIEEFDFESAEHKQLKGNIYLAKVTRVEPSLQAAFVDYGGTGE